MNGPTSGWGHTLCAFLTHTWVILMWVISETLFWVIILPTVYCFLRPALTRACGRCSEMFAKWLPHQPARPLHCPLPGPWLHARFSLFFDPFSNLAQVRSHSPLSPIPTVLMSFNIKNTATKFNILYLPIMILSRILGGSWALSLSVFLISLITGNSLHSASMTFPEFQGADSNSC